MLPRPAGRAGPRNSRAPAVAFAGSAALLLALLVLFAKPAPAAASPASLTGGPAAVTSANQLDERAIWLTPGDLATAAASQRADPTQLQQLRDKLLSRQSDGQASAAPEASTNSSRSRRLLKQQQRQLAAAPQKPSSKAGNSTLVLSGDAAPSPTSVADLYFLAANALQVKSANPGTAVRFDVPSLPVVSAPTPSFTNSTTPATAGAGTDAAGGTFGAASSGDEDGLGSDVMTAVAALAASPSASVLHPSGASNDTYVGAVQVRVCGWVGAMDGRALAECRKLARVGEAHLGQGFRRNAIWVGRGLVCGQARTHVQGLTHRCWADLHRADPQPTSSPALADPARLHVAHLLRTSRPLAHRTTRSTWCGCYCKCCVPTPAPTSP